MINLSEVTFSYATSLDGFRLGPVSLTMHPGMVYGWRGNNGSGKTTLASILARQRAPATGTIDGLPRRVLYFQQNIAANIFPDLTVHEHLQLCVNRERRDSILRIFPSLMEACSQYPDALSGGQLQRLAFSLVLSRDFDLYVLDEVTNHLDASTTDLVGHTMQELVKSERRPTVVFISHNHDFLKRFANVVVTFHEGQAAEILDV